MQLILVVDAAAVENGGTVAACADAELQRSYLKEKHGYCYCCYCYCYCCAIAIEGNTAEEAVVEGTHTGPGGGRMSIVATPLVVADACSTAVAGTACSAGGFGDLRCWLDYQSDCGCC